MGWFQNCRTRRNAPADGNWTHRRIAPSPRWLPIPPLARRGTRQPWALRLYVINPNSSQAVTAAIDQAVAPLRSVTGLTSCACPWPKGRPHSVATDVDGVIMPMLHKASELEESEQRLRHRMFFGSRPPCASRAEPPSCLRNRRMRRADGSHSRAALRRHCHPADFHSKASSLFRRDGRHGSLRRRPADRAQRCRSFGRESSTQPHGRGRPHVERRPWSGCPRHGMCRHGAISRCFGSGCRDPSSSRLRLCVAMAVGHAPLVANPPALAACLMES